MKSNKFDGLLKDISDAFYDKNYKYIQESSSKVFGTHEEAFLLSELAENLPYSIFEAFLLINLNFLLEKSHEELESIITTSNNKNKKLALYHIIQFLKSHSDIKNEHLIRLGIKLDNIGYTFNDNVPYKGLDKVNQTLYFTYNIQKEKISKFKKLFSYS
ncbi:hypothetical protein [Leminorella grimontii]|uniref:hypothetical protein n=1 Tax=Leminorella grimontii TaxID=82981 RepID=UPI00321FF0C4